MPIQQVRDAGQGFATVVTNATASVEADSAHVLPAANLVGGFGSMVPTAGRSLTLDTAANLDAAQPRAQVGDVFQYTIVNNSAGANAITFLTGAGITMKPTTFPTVLQNKAGTLTFVKTGAGAYDCYVSVSA